MSVKVLTVALLSVEFHFHLSARRALSAKMKIGKLSFWKKVGCVLPFEFCVCLLLPALCMLFSIVKLQCSRGMARVRKIIPDFI